MAWGAMVWELMRDIGLADLIGKVALTKELKAYQATCPHQVSPEPQGATHCWKCGLDLAKPALAKTRPPEPQTSRKVG